MSNRNCCYGRTPSPAAKASINRTVPPMNSMMNERSSRDAMCCPSSQEDRFPVGMAYVPWQKFRQVYEPSKGLCQGTIFAELDKPFCGRRGNL